MTGYRKKGLKVGEIARYESIAVKVVERFQRGWYIVKDETGKFYRLQRHQITKLSRKGGSKNDSRIAHARNAKELKEIRDYGIKNWGWKA